MSLTECNDPGSELQQGTGPCVSLQSIREKVMANSNKVGTILIEDGTPLPGVLEFETEPYSNGWTSVKNLNGYALERKIREAGWTLFDLGQIKASGFGIDGDKATGSAVARLVAKAGSDNFNSLEISHIATKRFLGFHCVTVTAHERHLQNSMFLLQDKRLAERNQAKLAYSQANRTG